jgi:fused signal recognition particle receptor
VPPAPAPLPVAPPAVRAPVPAPIAEPAVATERKSWLDKLKTGLRKTGTGIQAVFVNAQIDDALYEELESALLMADTGVKATEFLLDDLKRARQAPDGHRPPQVKLLLADAIADLLKPLEKPLVIGQFTAHGDHGGRRQRRRQDHLHRQAHAPPGHRRRLGAAGRGRHLPRGGARAAAVWADRNTVEIVSQEGGDPRP